MRWTFAAASAAALALAACSDGGSQPKAQTTPEKPVILGAEPTPRPKGACNRIVIDPGHDARANPATEPIGPRSSKRKIKDGGGTSGTVTHTPESVVNLQVSLRLRKRPLTAGYCVTITRSRQSGGSMGNVGRARIANRAHAALFVRIHADGNASSAK